MSTLFTYCLRVDDGAAPNPFYGICTLVICKPKIRSKAEVGDWVVGVGSKCSPIGDISKKVVYAMKVTQTMEMKQYDAWTKKNLAGKIPDLNHIDIKRWLGDSIYDFSVYPPKIRKGVHTKANRKKDLSGKYALLSGHFFYFGDNPISLPKGLLKISINNQGHRSASNDQWLDKFVKWVHLLGHKPNSLLGKPQCGPIPKTGTKFSCKTPSCRL